MASERERLTTDDPEEEVVRLRRRVADLEGQLRDTFERNPAIKLVIDPVDGAILDANLAAAGFYGWTVDELRAMRISDINQLPAELIAAEMARARDERRTYFEFRHRLRSGEARDVQVYSGPVEVGGRRVLQSVIVDISERTRLAEELAHAQRMDALSRLAGSIAHDFNNLLTAMEMITSVMQLRSGHGHRIDAELRELHDTVGRGSALTQQLLAFCRRQHLRPEIVDLREVVSDLHALLARTVGEDIAIAIELGDEAVPVLADRVQLEQVVLNLAINARDAMPEGGRLAIRVDARAEPAPATSWAILTVTDTGRGIAPEDAPHVFEPFFTTRRDAGGTGLGLSTVFGIVSQSGGDVSFTSAPDRGTRFTVELPLAVEPAPPREVAPRPATTPRGDETILLAEDETQIRDLVAATLRDHGYHVLVAEDGAAGLAAARAHAGPIHLLLTDVMMPRLGGRDLAQAVILDRPDVHVLYMSGYVGQPGLDAVLRDAGESFLAKPFSVELLLAKIREVLERAPRRGALRA